MIREIGIFIVFLLSQSAGAATTYIDPTCANNGDGTAQSCAASGGGVGAFNTWASQTTWTGNAKAYQRAGTTFTGACGFLINASGADTNNRIEIGAYGSGGKPKLNCTSGSYGFGWATRSYITISGMDFSHSSNSCLYLQGGVGNTITGNLFRSCAIYGISLDGGLVGHDHDNLEISSNTFSSTSSSAIAADIVTANVSTWTGIRIFDNDFESEVASGNSNAAIGLRWTTFPVQNTIEDLRIYSNRFSGINYSDDTPTSIIWVGRASLPSTPADQASCAPDSKIVGPQIYGNTFSRVGGNPIYVNNATTNSTYPVARISGNTIADVKGNTGIISFYSNGLYTYENTIDGIVPLATSSFIDGIGIDYDICNVGGSINRNKISNAPGHSSTTNSGQGVALFASNSVNIASNLISDVKIGIHLGNDLLGAAGTPNNIYNNTITRASTDGIQGEFTVEQVNNIKNNSITFSGDYAMDFAGSGDQTLANNHFFSNTTGNVNSNTDDATKVTAAPNFVGGTSPDAANGFRLRPTSPLIRAGTCYLTTGCVPRDFLNRRHRVPPNIGAFATGAGDQM